MVRQLKLFFIHTWRSLFLRLGFWEQLRAVLAAYPGATQRELADLLGVDQSYVCRLLKKG